MFFEPYHNNSTGFMSAFTAPAKNRGVYRSPNSVPQTYYNNHPVTSLQKNPFGHQFINSYFPNVIRFA